MHADDVPHQGCRFFLQRDKRSCEKDQATLVLTRPKVSVIYHLNCAQRRLNVAEIHAALRSAFLRKVSHAARVLSLRVDAQEKCLTLPRIPKKNSCVVGHWSVERVARRQGSGIAALGYFEHRDAFKGPLSMRVRLSCQTIDNFVVRANGKLYSDTLSPHFFSNVCNTSSSSLVMELSGV